MTVHRNPDQSLSEGVKVECNGIFISHVFGTVITSSAGISGASVAAAAALGANQAIVQAGTAIVFYRLDGVAPTAAAGMQIPAGGSITLSMADALNALFISATGTLLVTFTM